MKHNIQDYIKSSLSVILLVFTAISCDKASTDEMSVLTPENSSVATNSTLPGETVVLLIDEESIDNGNLPNNFSETDVNDQVAKIGQRQTLRYFSNNVGKTITLYTGEVGDEGWYALKTIPASWKTAGPTVNGTRNFLLAGPGLGGGNDPEKYLDKIPDVTPLRATGIKMLTGKTVLAVVYDSDVAINFGPLYGILKGDNLGVVAFDVLETRKRTDGSSGSLPSVTIRIRSVSEVSSTTLKLFSNAPVPRSSSEPFDINPPVTVSAPVLVNAE
ncbi:hypothetical protein PDL71_18065 [Lacibacter sp. MH-610]|uniref:hypothetical protein n=1 Tax=Lacibacter sp. MH-610 TaxID=3020883 RepID=UPI0038911FBE